MPEPGRFSGTSMPRTYEIRQVKNHRGGWGGGGTEADTRAAARPPRRPRPRPGLVTRSTARSQHPLFLLVPVEILKLCVAVGTGLSDSTRQGVVSYVTRGRSRGHFVDSENLCRRLPAAMDKASEDQLPLNAENKPPNDPRSFAKRMAELKKPDAIDQPDEEKVQAVLAGINDKIGKRDKRLVHGL
jgi:hypothetical protein